MLRDMRLCHIALAVLIALPVTADIRLGPEVPVLPNITAGPAAFAQRFPTVASNGHGFLATWYDTREQASSGNLYVAPLDADGRVIERFGHKLGEMNLVWPGQPIASNGDGYLVAWAKDLVYRVRPLDANGNPAGEERVLSSYAYVRNLLSNGSTYLAVAANTNGDLFALSMDRNGVVLGTAALGMNGLTPVTAIAENGRYTLVGRPFYCNAVECGARVLKTVEDHAGSLTVTGIALPVSGDVAAAISPERILFVFPATVQGGTLSYSVYDRASNTTAPSVSLPVAAASNNVRAAWDGSEFLIMSLTDAGVLNATRVNAQGSPAGGPFRLSGTAKAVPAFASNGDTRLLIWEDAIFSNDGDLSRRAVRSFAELGNPPDAITMFGSGHAQPAVAVAASPSSLMAAWRDDAGHEIEAALNGVPIVVDRQTARYVSNPAVTYAGNRFLVAWYDLLTVDDARLLARRYAADGTPIDPAPLAVIPNVVRHNLDDAPGVAADGSSFVISDDSNGIGLLRLDGETGVVTELSRSSCPYPGCWGSFAPIKAPTEWLVPYLGYYSFVSPHVTVTWGVIIQQTPFSGTGVRTTGTVQVCGFNCMQLGISGTGEQVTTAIPSTNGVHIGQGVPPDRLQQGRLIAEPLGVSAAAVAWNGAEYVVVWTTLHGGPIHAMRLDTNGQLLDNAPFEIAPSGSTTASPSIAPVAGGVIIGYSRATAENGGAPRAFTRTLDAIARVPRRQSVRH